MYNGVVVSDCDSDQDVKSDIKSRDTYSYSTGNRATGIAANRKLPDLPKTPESTGMNCIGLEILKLSEDGSASICSFFVTKCVENRFFEDK